MSDEEINDTIGILTEKIIEMEKDNKRIREKIKGFQFASRQSFNELREKTDNYTEMALDMTKIYHKLRDKVRDISLSNTAKILNQNKIVADYAEFKEQLNELKERVDFLLDSELQAKETDYIITEVLRDFLIAYKEVNLEREHNGCLYSLDVRKLLAKLDVGSASARESLDRQTVNRELIKEALKDPKNSMKQIIKDSEGEKVRSAAHTEKPNVVTVTTSEKIYSKHYPKPVNVNFDKKPPEPITPEGLDIALEVGIAKPREDDPEIFSHEEWQEYIKHLISEIVNDLEECRSNSYREGRLYEKIKKWEGKLK